MEATGPALCYTLYGGAWLGFLCCKHYGQARAAHIFELNFLLNSVILCLIWTIVDMQVLHNCLVLATLEAIFSADYFFSICLTHIDTAVFLKTMSADTMITNTAGWICLGMKIPSSALGILLTFLLPESQECPRAYSQTTSLPCDFFRPFGFYRTTIIFLFTLLIILAVMGFTMYRSHSFKQPPLNEQSQPSNNSSEPVDDIAIENNSIVDNEAEGISIKAESIEEVMGMDTSDGENGRKDDIVINVIDALRYIQTAWPEEPLSLNDNVRDAEVLRIDHALSAASPVVPCFGPGNEIFRILQKYLNNTLLSLAILAVGIPENVTLIYAFITEDGCEEESFGMIADTTYLFMGIFGFLIPYLVKKKLDRLSE